MQVVKHEEILYYKTGYECFGRQSVLVGMSPGNGYFTEDRMVSIILEFCRKVPKVYILIPDSPHIYNFLGMGYPVEEAKKKSKKDINQTYNRLERAITRLISRHNISNFQIVEWERDIASNAAYNKVYARIIEEYEENLNFRDVINCVAHEYLAARSKDRTLIHMDVGKGAIYYLAELALFVRQQDIFGEELTVAYYKKWSDGLDFLARIFPGFLERFSMLHYIFDIE